MLSRHFYDLEEVQAALRYCVIHHETRETLFWCYELLCSGCASEAISTLFEAWLWHKGPFHLSWLISTWKTLAVEEVSEEAILDAAFQLSQLPCTDHSLSTVLVLQVAERTSPFPRTLANDQCQDAHEAPLGQKPSPKSCSLLDSQQEYSFLSLFDLAGLSGTC